MASRGALVTGLVLLALGAALLARPLDEVPLFYDILGYTSQARSLMRGLGNVIPVGGELLPGYYPAGLPALITLPFALLGPDPRHGVWVVLACALAGLLLVATVARRHGGVAAGLAAGLLLLSSAMFRQMSGYIMTQVPTGALIVLVAWLWLAPGARGALFAAGLLAVASLLLRFANVFFPLALGLSEMLCGAGREGGRARRLAVLGAGMAAGALLVAAHNTWAYGSPLATGYGAWSHELAFSLGNIFSPPGAPNRDESFVLTKAWLGLSEVQPLAFTVALAAGAAWCWRRGGAAGRRLLALTVLSAAGNNLFLALYAFRSDNYLLPCVPLLAVVAGLGASAWWPARRAAAGALLAAAVLATSVVRAPPPTLTETESIARFASLSEADRVLERDALLITSADPGLAEPLLAEGSARALVYLGPHVSPLVERAALVELGAERLDGAAVLARAERARAEGRAVYFDQNPPPRGLAPIHLETRRALHRAFDFVPSGATNVFRLEPILSAPPSGN